MQATKTAKQASLVILLLCLFVASAAAQASYQIHDLGVIGGRSTYATGINSAGQIAGYGAFSHSVVWTSETAVDIPVLAGARYADAYAINDSGYVVGDAAFTDTGFGRAWVWYGGSDVRPIDVLPGYSYNMASSINNAGTVVGLCPSNDWYHSTAFKWSPTGGLSPLAPLPGFVGSWAESANDFNVVVGACAPGGDGHWKACLWNAPGDPEPIGPPEARYSCAMDVNNAGQVALIAWLVMSDYRSFLWSTESGLIDMGDLGGGQTSCNALNSVGQAVGWSYVETNVQQAFVWSRDTGIIPLPSLECSDNPIYSEAMSINDSGLIVGYSRASGGPLHAVLWTPVPEPSSLLVLVAGLLGLMRLVLARKP